MALVLGTANDDAGQPRAERAFSPSLTLICANMSTTELSILPCTF